MGYTNSSLVDCKVMSPNHSGTRTHKIDRITPHCVVGQLKAENIGYCFDDISREASCNYGIGTEGRVCLIVDEENRSWCTSSGLNDQRAITIECASDFTAPYAFNDKVYSKLIDLCTDICKRNGKSKLIWFGDKDKTLNYEPASNEMVLTVHRWFANKSCPGDWMYARMGDLAAKVNSKLNYTEESKEETKTEIMYSVQVGAYSKKENAENMMTKLKAAGFDAIIVENAKANEKTENNTETKPEDSKETILKEGDLVVMQKGAPVYGKNYTFKDWVYDRVLFVRSIDNDRVVVSTMPTGSVTGPVDKKYLSKF